MKRQCRFFVVLDYDTETIKIKVGKNRPKKVKILSVHTSALSANWFINDLVHAIDKI
jgi:hypothetical protein